MYNFKNTSGKFKIRITDERFCVDKEKKTVTATANVSVVIPDGLRNLFDWKQLPNGFRPRDWYTSNYIIEYTYTARCSDGDIFDEKIGKKVAMAGLEKKAYRGMNKRLSKWAGRLQDYINNTLFEQVMDFHVRSRHVVEHNTCYVDSLTQNNE